MKKIITIIILCTQYFTYGQLNFEKGFYINNNGEKISGYINNEDWRHNPIDFQFRINENSETITKTLNEVQSFSIPNLFKFVRKEVTIETSSEKTNKLDRDKKPHTKNATVFLKQLIEGNINLYTYNYGDIRNFFFQKENEEIQLLIYKKFLNHENYIKENNRFKQQLYNNLKCPEISLKSVENTSYEEKSLVKLFEKYHACKNQDFTKYDRKNQQENRTNFSLNIKPHLLHGTFHIEDFAGVKNIETEKTYPGIGLELEYYFPFKNKKWSLFTEALYNKFEDKIETSSTKVSGGKVITEIDYEFIEIFVGARYNAPISEKSKLYISVYHVLGIGLSSTVDFKRENNSFINNYDFKSSGTFGFGAGYKFMDRYSVGIRYLGERELTDYGFEDMTFKGFSFNLGVSLLKF